MKQTTKDGFFFLTIEKIEERTCIKRSRQDKAIKNLIDLKLIEKKLIGMPRRRYFKTCDENILRFYSGPPRNCQFVDFYNQFVEIDNQFVDFYKQFVDFYKQFVEINKLSYRNLFIGT